MHPTNHGSSVESIEAEPSSLSSYPGFPVFSAYHNQHDQTPDPMLFDVTTPLYPNLYNNQQIHNPFIPDIASSQLAAPYSSEYYLPSHQFLNNHDSDLRHQDQTEMESEQDAYGETDEDENINENQDSYAHIREEETEGQMSDDADDESEEDNNERGYCECLIFDVNMILS